MDNDFEKCERQFEQYLNDKVVSVNLKFLALDMYNSNQNDFL